MILKNLIQRIAIISLILCGMAVAHRAVADVTITSFSNFKSDALYASWSWKSASIISTSTNYVITATGYGANWKYIGSPHINGAGCTNIELDVTLSGPPAADGKLGPIVELIDANGNDYTYAWYGQTLGHHVLDMPIQSPTFTTKLGTPPGLDPASLQHMHMKIDPSDFTNGAYTVSWNKLSLVGGAAAPAGATNSASQGEQTQ